jgi:integral membrane protein
MNSPLSRLRIIGDVEGVSYLVLLFIAMPLKYLAGMPQAVRVVGSIHGFLFVAFVIALWDVWRKRGWSVLKTLLAFASSLVPFGTFALNRQIRQEERID